MKFNHIQLLKLKNYFHSTHSPYSLKIVRSKGSHIFDENGKSYLDCTSGFSANNFGHLHPRVKSKIEE